MTSPLHRARLASAGLTALQALVLTGFAVFYLVELGRGQGDDAARVVSSAVLILVVAVGLGVLVRGWLSPAPWPRTPTIVWNLILVPVAVALVQSGQGGLGGGLAAVVVLTLAAAIAAPGRTGDEPAQEPSDGDGAGTAGA